MYGRGNPGSQFGQGFQSAVWHAYQQHVPPPFLPPSSGQPQTGTYPGPLTASGQFVQTGVKTYEHMARPPLNSTNQSYVHAPLPPPLPIRGTLQLPGAYLNAQQNAPNTAYAGNQNLHNIPTPLPPRVAPPLQGQSTYWSPANFQTHPVGAQGSLPSVPTSDPSGSTLSTTPSMGGNPMSLVSLPPPPPPPTSPPPMQPSPPSFGCLHPVSSLPTALSSQMHVQDTGKVADSEGKKLEALEDVEAQNGAEHKFSRYGDTVIREDKGSNVVNSQVGDSSVLGVSVVSDLPPPPIKPKEEKVIQKIEVLCQFIAKNGPGFEEMARQKESGNPEFKFLFGGEPGSEAAIAHEYFQWLKKIYNMGKSQEESIDNSSRHLKEDSSVHHAQSMATASVDIHSDSDMEMEDDITHTDKDTGMGGSAADILSQEDGKESAVPLNVQICAPPSGFSSEKVPCLEKTGLDGQVIKNGSPFRLLQEYSSDESSDIDDETLLKEKVTESIRSTVGAASLAGSGDNERLIETNLGSRFPGEGEKDPEALLECNLKAATNSFEFRREVQMTTTNTLASGLSGKTSEEDNDKKESVPDAPPSEAFRVERSLTSSSDRIAVSGRSDKENAENIQEPASLKVDEFGRLLRNYVNDSDSDDSRSAERYNRKGKYRRRSRSRSRSRSPVDRRSRQSRRERRSTSCSWSPRRRRSRSRSPVSRRLHEFRHDNIRRDKSRMPECFDFLRGKCYRGASCRYWHHDAELDRSRHQQRKRQNLEVSLVQENFDSIGEKDLSQGRSTFRDHEVKVKANERLTVKSLSSAEEQNSEDPLIDTEQVSVCNAHGLSDNSKNLSTQKDKQLVQEGSIDSSSRNTNAKSSQGMENHQPLSIDLTGQPVANAETQSLQDAQHPSQPSVHLPPAMQGEGAQNFHQPMLDAAMPPASAYASQSANGDGLSSNALSSSQQFLFPAPQVPWSSVPPQPVPPVHLASSGGDATPSVYNDYQLMPYATQLRPDSTEMPSQSYADQFQHQASNLTQNPSRSHMYTADYRIGTLPGSNLQNQQIGVPGLLGELHSHGIQPYSSGSLAPAGSLPSSSQTYFYPQQQNLSPGLHYGKATNNLDMTTSMNSALCPIPDKNPASHMSDFGGSRLSTHYNPYASTFEQPLSSKFSSDTTMQDFRNRYNTSSQLVHGPMGQATFSPRSAAAIPHNIPLSHGDQYDPLFDSIEPSSNSMKRSDNAPQSGLNKPLDVEKSNKNKEIGAFSPSASLDDDGFGETAEAEVGAVENASPSDPADLANDTGNDVEIDQVKSPDKNKKPKDSRSMKLFKVALADFVKEVLRPSWRQGNMSKEAFKTIVKKTVDKVTGSMKGHRIPKSQSKINHYIDSSQRKLTKLVMGYVDKYVKV